MVKGSGIRHPDNLFRLRQFTFCGGCDRMEENKRGRRTDNGKNQMPEYYVQKYRCPVGRRANKNNIEPQSITSIYADESEASRETDIYVSEVRKSI